MKIEGVTNSHYIGALKYRRIYTTLDLILPATTVELNRTRIRMIKNGPRDKRQINVGDPVYVRDYQAKGMVETGIRNEEFWRSNV